MANVQINSQSKHIDRTRTIDRLRSFCRGELSAAETYEKALGQSSMRSYADLLRDCQQSHIQRAQLLSEQIRRLGGEVPDSSGVWGTFLSLIEGAAATMSARAGIAVLEEGEDRWLASYRDNLNNLDAQSQTFVRDHILAGQIESHRAMSNLKRSLEG